MAIARIKKQVTADIPKPSPQDINPNRVSSNPGKRGTPLETKPDGMLVWGYNYRGNPVCCSPRAGNPKELCRSYIVMFPSGRCKKHGGPIQPGPTNPTYKTGATAHRYTAVLKGKLAESYAQDMANRETLTDMSDDVAVARGLVRENMSVLEDGLDDYTLKHLKELAARLEAALQPDQPIANLHKAANAVILFSRKGANRRALEKNLISLQRHLAEMSTVEIKRQEQQAGTMHQSQVMLLLTDILGTVKEVVTERSAIIAIASAINKGVSKLGLQLSPSEIESNRKALAERTETLAAIEADYVEEEE